MQPVPNQSARGSNIAQALGPGARAAVNVLHWPGPQPVDETVLSAAHQRLATLPRETIPPLADGAPPGSRIPLRPNLFVGREAELMQLAALIGSSDGADGRAVVAITGPVVAGKSRLAMEFVHRYGRYFAGGVFWLNSAVPNDLPLEVADCASEDLGLRPDFRSFEFEDQVQLVKAAWQIVAPTGDVAATSAAS